MTALLAVPFRGDTITCVETPDGVFVAVTPICRRLGLSERGQIQRLNREPERWGACVMHVPSMGGEQAMNCIPLSRVAAWLFTVESGRVKPEVREALVAYQNEAADVLDRHFRLRASEKEAEIAHLSQQLAGCHEELMNLPKWSLIRRLDLAGVHPRIMAFDAKLRHWQVDVILERMEACGMKAPRGLSSGDAATLLSEMKGLRFQLSEEKRRRALAEAKLAEWDESERLSDGRIVKAGHA